jgi:hypothetical protein
MTFYGVAALEDKLQAMYVYVSGSLCVCVCKLMTLHGVTALEDKLQVTWLFVHLCESGLFMRFMRMCK